MIILISAIINLIFLYNHEKIAKKLNLYDIPDHNRKLHKQKVPLTGGLFFFINLCFYFFYTLIRGDNFLIFEDDHKNLLFIISVVIFYLIGHFDDKINFSASKRLLFFILIISVNLWFIPELHLKNIRISFLENFFIGNFSYFWTLICFLLFINAFNFFDGINLQSGCFIILICLYFFIKSFLISLSIIIILTSLFFLKINFSSKSFLGNSGSYFLPFFFGSLFIILYNTNTRIYADEIVMLIFIPGLDLMRLFIERIINKKNPMHADRNHLHHYLIKKKNNIEAIFIIYLIICLPLLILFFYKSFLLVIFCQSLLYFITLFKMR